MAEKSSKKNNVTNGLLKFGVAAGPLYVTVGVIEILTRPGFDVKKHSLSLMSLGEMGWVHIALFFITGLFVILGAIGIRKAIKGEKGGTWGPILLGLYGLSLIAAGYFVPDPMKGFPPGTTGNMISNSGLMHLVSGMVGFTGFIAACFVFARRFKALKEKHMQIFSLKAGFIFLFAFIGIAGFSQAGEQVATIVNLAFYFAVLVSWIWLSTVTAKLIKK